MLKGNETGNHIWITPDRLAGQAEAIRSAAGRIITQTALADQYLKMLSGAWKGADADQAMRKGRLIKIKVEKAAAGLQELSAAMQMIVRDTKEAEEKNMNRIS